MENPWRRTALETVAVVALSTLAAGRLAAQTTSPGYSRSVSSGDTYATPSGARLTTLVDARTLGGPETEIVEITIPPGKGTPHRHGAVEIIYVLSGELTHIVNDTAYVLRPGMVGIVRPSDTVVHRVAGSEPARVLVIWPGSGELDRVLARGFSKVSSPN
jgi:quercetin dioxygenase-like cupin family protein